MPRYTYTDEVAETICARIAEGESLRGICSDHDMPCKATVMNWLLRPEHKDFVDQYARARESQAEHYLDEIIEISDNATDDVQLLKQDDDPTIKHSAIQRARLQVDTRKWVMGKLAPKKYGDKGQMEISTIGDDGKPAGIKFTVVRPE